MQERAATLSALIALVAALALSACGGSPQEPELTIAFTAPDAGPLKARADDMRRAAQLNLDAIDARAAGHRLKLVIGPYPGAVAAIRAPGAGGPQARGQLEIRLDAPRQRSTTPPPRAQRLRHPRIWLVPPQATARRVTGEYAASGADGARTAVADGPAAPGTPAGRYVTAALSRDVLPPAGGAFFAKFNDKFDRAPDRWAIYAYEAVGLIVDALHKLQAEGTAVDRETLASRTLTIRNRFSPLGHYDVLPSGQSTLYLFQARGAGAPQGPGSLIESLR